MKQHNTGEDTVTETIVDVELTNRGFVVVITYPSGRRTNVGVHHARYKANEQAAAVRAQLA